ncbi:UU173 family protein [Mycoplasma sp. VS299A]|uniref:UU173 family protein n=1 Tax=Mycoplasma sp. VS299A TaxID=3401690 RepID=UPI003AAEBA49
MQEKDPIIIKWNTFKKVFYNNPAMIYNTSNLQDRIIETEYKKKWSYNPEDHRKLLLEIEEDETGLAEKDDENISALNEMDIFFQVIDDHFEVDVNQNIDFDNISESYINIHLDSYVKYKKDAINWYIKTYYIDPKRVAFIRPTDKLDNKIQNTKDFLQSQDIDLIIDPVLCYQVTDDHNNTFKFVSDGLFYDKKNKKLSTLSYVSRAKNTQFYHFWFLQKIFKRNGIDLNECSTIIIDPISSVKKTVKQNEILFYESYSAYPLKSIAKSNSNKLTADLIDLDFILKKTGDATLLGYNGYYERNNMFSFLKVAKSGLVIQTGVEVDKNAIAAAEENDLTLDKITSSYLDISIYQKALEGYLPFKFKGKGDLVIRQLENFDFYVDLMIKSWYEFNNENSFDYNAIKYFYAVDSNENDTKVKRWMQDGFIGNIDEQIFTFPEYFSPLERATMLNYILGNKYDYYSGNAFKPAEKKSYELISNKILKLKNNINFFNIQALNVVKKIHIKDARICWYDYEGFMSLYPIIDNVPSYNQVINQVSIILTQNGNEIYKENIVIDTLNLKLIDIVKMLKAIYCDAADAYVVYNKSYENTRNKEVLSLVRKQILYGDGSANNLEFITQFDKLFPEGLKEFEHIIFHINTNTIDLADCFNRYASEKLPVNNMDHELSEYIFFKDNEEEHTIEVLNDIDYEKFQQITSWNSHIISINYLMYYYSIKKIEKYITHLGLKLKTLITPYKDLEIQKGTMAMEKAMQRNAGIIGDTLWNELTVPALKLYCENDVKAMIMVYELIMYLARLKFKNELDLFEYKIEAQNFEYFINDDKKLDIKIM